MVVTYKPPPAAKTAAAAAVDDDTDVDQVDGGITEGKFIVVYCS